MNTKNSSTIVFSILTNIIPVVGIVLFNWALFEIAVTYVVESSAKFFVFIIDQNFIRKSTNERIDRAIGQTLIISSFFIGIMFVYTMVLYAISGNAEVGRLEETLLPALKKMHLGYLLFYFLILELIMFYTKIKWRLKHPDDNFYRVFKNFITLHVLVISGVLLFSTLNNNLTIAYTLLILLKVIYDLILLKRGYDKK